MSKITRRRLLGGAAAVALLTRHEAQAAFSLSTLLAPNPPPPSSPGTLTIINDSASTIPSGSVTQSFGWFFGHGAIPALAVTTCTLNGTTSVVVASVAGMANGQTILIDGVPTGTHIVSISGTTLTLSQAATISGSGITAVVPGAPQFNAGSHVFSWGQHVLNPLDHSLKWCRFWLKLGASILGHTSLSIPITSGGAHPTASGYTMSDFTGEGIVVTGAAWGSSINNARTTSTVRSYLTSNTDVNIWSNQIDGDGDAGQSRKFITHMITGSMGSATADGLLECEHFMHVFPGALGKEIRWVGAITQPWYNGASVPGDQTVFSSASFVMNSGSANNIANLGVKNFTRSGASLNIGSAAYYRGTDNGPSGVPVMASVTGGTLASPLVNNHLYWACQSVSSNNVDLSEFNTLFLNGANNLTTNGSGTQTLTPVAVSVPFDRLFFMGTDAKYQHWSTGSGSLSADITARNQIDQAAWIATGFFPPYGSSLGFVPASTTTVTPTSANWPWDPYTLGDGITSLSTNGGERAGIGLMCAQQVSHFYNQDQLGELLIRTIGLAGAHQVYNFWDNATPNLINLLGPSASYRGMPAYDGAHFVTWRTGAGGFNFPAGVGPTCIDSNDTEHQVSYSAYAYMMTGERQYLCITEENANGAILQAATDQQHRNPTVPLSVMADGIFGAGTGVHGGLFNGEFRTMGWADRNVQFAGGLTPFVHPDGSQRNQYLQAMAAQQSLIFLKIMDPSLNFYTPSPGSATAQTYLTTTGCYLPATYDANGGNAGPIIATPGPIAFFEQPYFVSARLVAATLGQDANALAWLKTCVTFYDHINTTFGIWTLFGYYFPGALDASHILFSDDTFGAYQLSWTGGFLTYNGAGIGGAPSGQLFTVNPPGNGWVITNGDKFNFSYQAAGLPAAMVADPRTQAYWVVNAASGVYFDLARTKGGSPITLSGTGVISEQNIGYLATSGSPYNSTTGAACLPLDGGPADQRGIMGWLSKLGITGINNTTTTAVTIAAMDLQFSNSGGVSIPPKYFWR